ncbi:hypothetical protein Hanom_Chr14g01331101 [Helianthus anomalus]
MTMGIYRQGSLSGGELGRKIPSAVRGTVQLPFFSYMMGILIWDLEFFLNNLKVFVSSVFLLLELIQKVVVRGGYSI